MLSDVINMTLISMYGDALARAHLPPESGTVFEFTYIENIKMLC